MAAQGVSVTAQRAQSFVSDSDIQSFVAVKGQPRIQKLSLLQSGPVGKLRGWRWNGIRLDVFYLVVILMFGARTHLGQKTSTNKIVVQRIHHLSLIL